MTAATGRLRSRKALVPGTGLSLSEQAYAALKDRINSLFFVPGQFMNEASICQLLELGRTPVRQALQRLELEGMVEIIPRKGVLINPDSVGQILQILDARSVLEPAFAARAAERATTRDVAELKSILDQGSRLHGGGAIDGFVDTDRAFHGKIAEMAGSAMLADFFRALHERSARSWYLLYWKTLDEGATEADHRAVLKGIQQRRPATAEAAMRAHIERLREKLQRVQAGGMAPAAPHPAPGGHP